MMKILFFFCMLFLSCASYAVPLIQAEPVIDGVISEDVWKGIPWRSGFTVIGTDTPASGQTRFKTFNNGKSLFFAVECEEANPDGIVRKRYSPSSDLIWMNDSVEINLVPDAKVLSFYKIIADATGTYTGFFGQDDNTGKDKFIVSASWASDAKIKTVIGKDKWTLEAEIPFGSMNFVPSDGTGWRMNIARNRWTGKSSEFSSWSRLPQPKHMIPKAFNSVVVEGFDARNYAFEIENFKGEVSRTDDKPFYGISAAVHNNSGSFRILKQVYSLIDRKNNRTFSASAFLRLQNNSYALVSAKIPNVPNGEYLLSWSLYSNTTEPVLLKRMIRSVSIEYIPLSVRLVRPAYRNNIYASMPDKTIEAVVELRESAGTPVTVELKGENFKDSRQIACSAESNRVLFDGERLKDGAYTLSVSAEQGGHPRTVSLGIRKLPYQKGEVWLDSRGVMHIDGKPFLGYGWYAAHGKRQPFYNSLLNTARFADMREAVDNVKEAFEEYGLRSMLFPFQDLAGYHDWRWIDFKDPETRKKGLTPEQRKKIIEFVTAVGKLESVFGWYMADEPECRDNNPIWYEEALALISELDPYHPCFMLNWGIDGIRKYYKGCDILIPDCYPQYFEDGTTGKPRWSPSEYAKASTALRPAWQMPLMTLWPDLANDGKTRGTAPSFHDQRSQFFQAVIHNVKGFNMYAWFDSQRFSSLVIGPQAMGETLQAMRDYIFEDSVPNGVTVETSPAGPQFQAGVKVFNRQKCIVAVNPYLERMEVSFKLKDNFSGTLYVGGENRSVQVQNGLFKDQFDPNMTHLYFSDRNLAESLPSVEETSARIETFRAARKKKGNLIGIGEISGADYIRYGKLQLDPGIPRITASSDSKFYLTRESGSLYYLVDGLTEVENVEYSWSPLSTDQKPWITIRLDRQVPLSKLKLFSPCGNLKSGTVTIGSSILRFDNPEAKTEIEVPLGGATADEIKIEITQYSRNGKGINGRLLTEIELY